MGVVAGSFSRNTAVSSRLPLVSSIRMDWTAPIPDRGSTKGSMVVRLADLLHIDRKNIYCAGDNQNDISMLAVSAIPFAPANCAPEVKEWGARVLCHCNDGLMAEIVALLDRRYPEQ